MHVLENGLKVVLQESHSAPVVALQVWVEVGSADDPEQRSGLAHVLEHMVFKGTARRSEGEIAREIEGCGGQINAWTSFDQTVFHVVLPSRHLAKGLDILADAVQNARFDQAELDRELQVILEEIRQGEDSPSKVVARELFATSFQRHPYGRPVIGRESSVRGLARSAVEQFFRTWYVPSNMTVVAVGDFAPSELMRRVRRLFPSGPRRAAPRRARPAEPAQQRPRVTVRHRDTKESYFSLAFHIPRLVDPQTPALDLAAVVLGQGEGSRLVRRLKHEQQLVTDVYAYSYTPLEPGLLIVGATCQHAKLREAVAAVGAEIFRLGASELAPEELRRAKIIIESDAVYQKETVQGQARKLGFFRSVAGQIEFEQEYNRRAADASPAQVREVAARQLRLENLSLAVVTPASSGTARQLERELLAALSAAGQQVGEAETVEVRRSDDVLKMTLGNGARLLVLQDSSVPLVAMRAVWSGGLRHENSENNGINNLLAALLTRGTATRSADQVNEAIEGMAGTIGGFSGLNSFGIRAELLARHWEQGMEILADCLLNPAFKPQEVERTRQQALEDIRAQQDNLSAVAMQLFARTFYKKHPYRLDPLGTLESVSSLTREHLIRYYRQRLNPSAMVLAVVGDVDVERVQRKFRSLFGRVRRLSAPPLQVEKEPARSEPESALAFSSKQQAHLVVGYPGADVFSRDRFALQVLASVLSGQGGRLFLELRDRRGLAYQVGAYSQEGLDAGHFALYVATSPSKINAALGAIEEQLRLLRDHPISVAELKRVQRYLVGNYDISLQRRSTLASLLAFNEAYGLGYQAYRRYTAEVSAVTVTDLQRVARKYLDESRRVVAIVRPEELSPGAAKRLAPGTQAGVVTSPLPAAPAPRKPAKGKKRVKAPAI